MESWVDTVITGHQVGHDQLKDCFVSTIIYTGVDQLKNIQESHYYYLLLLLLLLGGLFFFIGWSSGTYQHYIALLAVRLIIIHLLNCPPTQLVRTRERE